MGIYFELENYDAMFAQSKHEPFVINDQPTLTEEDREKISRKTRTTYDNVDVFSNIPSCECGETVGGRNLNYVCKNCRKKVVEAHDVSLEPRVWIRAPHGVEALINPVIWNMLRLAFDRKDGFKIDKPNQQGFNYIDWLTDTDYRPRGNKPEEELDILAGMGVQRGYNNFVRNIEAYVSALKSLKSFEKKSDNGLLELISKHRDAVFCAHVPLPNKSLLLIENTHFATFVDPDIKDVFEAITNMQGIDTEFVNFSQRQKENRTSKTMTRLGLYHYNVYYSQVARKPGLIRKNVLGTRCHFSTRAVISSNTKPHVYDELELPWGPAVTLFSVHLRGMLMNDDMTPDESKGFIEANTFKFDPKLDKLLTQLFENTPGGRGFANVFVRNPTLTRGSTQRMFFSRHKKDVTDNTIGLSALTLVSYNAKQIGSLISNDEWIIP